MQQKQPDDSDRVGQALKQGQNWTHQGQLSRELVCFTISVNYFQFLSCSLCGVSFPKFCDSWLAKYTTITGKKYYAFPIGKQRDFNFFRFGFDSATCRKALKRDIQNWSNFLTIFGWWTTFINSIKIIVVGLSLCQVLHCMKIQQRDLHLHIKGQSKICIKTLDKVDDYWGISYWREIFKMLHFVKMCIVVCMKCLVFSIMFSFQFAIVIGIK